MRTARRERPAGAFLAGLADLTGGTRRLGMLSRLAHLQRRGRERREAERAPSDLAAAVASPPGCALQGGTPPFADSLDQDTWL
ncbi:hypothetical protein ACQEV2_41530 [Streptomyces sp. CA-251387]|uniref:hypothetical protein n=1 Tax=Streptomyces sp. CA-251387 TaxID=3240064 RepID=UPI003D903700